MGVLFKNTFCEKQGNLKKNDFRTPVCGFIAPVCGFIWVHLAPCVGSFGFIWVHLGSFRENEPK